MGQEFFYPVGTRNILYYTHCVGVMSFSGVYILQQVWKIPPFWKPSPNFTIAKKKKLAWERGFLIKILWKIPLPWAGGIWRIHPRPLCVTFNLLSQKEHIFKWYMNRLMNIEIQKYYNHDVLLSMIVYYCFLNVNKKMMGFHTFPTHRLKILFLKIESWILDQQ